MCAWVNSLGHLTSKEAKSWSTCLKLQVRPIPLWITPRGPAVDCAVNPTRQWYWCSIDLSWFPLFLLCWLDPWVVTVSSSYQPLMLSACHIMLWNFQCLFIKTDLFLVTCLFSSGKSLWEKKKKTPHQYYSYLSFVIVTSITNITKNKILAMRVFFY